jgi:hypothetical protein
MLKIFLLSSFFLLFMLHDATTFAQQKQDTVLIKTNPSVVDSSRKNLLAQDTAVRKIYNPKVATFRSAVLPGWGQAYNRKYWKIPIIYGALGTTAGIFLYNLKTYKVLRKAVIILSDSSTANDTLVNLQYRLYGVNNLRTVRNEFRQNIDYSVLVFIIFWGLNIVDATVDAHLKAFDVSPDIAMKIRPGLNTSGNGPGVSFVFFFRDNHHKAPLPPL